MGEQLYNIINSSTFQIVAVIWFIILVLWKDKWLGVLIRTVNLIKKPTVFTRDEHPENVPTYPRAFLEEVSTSFRGTLTQPLINVARTFHIWLSNVFNLVYDQQHPFRTIGYVVLFACFGMLVYSDAVAIANTLYVLNISTDINPLLTNFDFAVFAGSLIALILGLAFLFETMSNNSEFTPMSEREPRIRKALFALALLISLLSIISLVAWGLARINIVENLGNTFLDRFVNIVVLFVIPLNSALTAAMIFNEAIRGLVFLVAVFGYVVEGILHVLNFALTLLSSLLPFIVDVLYRLLHIVVDIIVWIVTTPIFALFLPFMAIYKLVADNTDSLQQTKMEKDLTSKK